MNSEGKPQSRKDNIVVQKLDGEVLIYDLKVNKAFCLNETLALVWQSCDGNKSVPEISRQVSKTIGESMSDDLIWLAISELKKENLLANGEDITNKFEGLSRREVIRKIGFASMVALPVISSLLAPTAIQAASGRVTCANGLSPSPTALAPGQPVTCNNTAGNCATVNQIGCRSCTATERPSADVGGFCQAQGFTYACVCN